MRSRDGIVTTLFPALNYCQINIGVFFVGILFVQVFLTGDFMRPQMNPPTIAILATLILLATPLFLSAQEDQDADIDVRHERVNSWQGDWQGPVHPFSSLIVPKEQLPPHGECRVWLPGKAPADQPASLACASAAYTIPPGAWVITHAESHYTVEIYDRKKKNTVAQVRRYQLR